jgi:hypothetical protein
VNVSCACPGTAYTEITVAHVYFVRCGFANGLLFSSGNLMAAAGFFFGAWKIKKSLEDTYQKNAMRYLDMGNGTYVPMGIGANCANNYGSNRGCIFPADSRNPDCIPRCGFSGGNLMIAMFAIQ